jgi:hypothetical protein
MKKVKLLLGIFCLIFVTACNCCNKEAAPAEGACQAGEKKCCAAKCEMTEEQKALCEKWQNFDTLPVEEQKELLAGKKACIEKRLAEKKACIEKCQAELAEFDNLTIAEQKELLDAKQQCLDGGCCKEKAKCCKEKNECNKEEKKECTKTE